MATNRTVAATEHDAASAQIGALSRRDRAKPLIICDVDEVLVEFIRPFMAFLSASGFELSTETYRLTGNIRSRVTGQVTSGDAVGALLNRFFATQHVWQTPVPGARDQLIALSQHYEIVLLTAMPSGYRTLRARMLRDLGFPYPLIAANRDKGDLIRTLGEGHSRTVFIDDLPANHHSVADHAPHVERAHIMAFREFGSGIPDLPDGTIGYRDWQDLGAALTP